MNCMKTRQEQEGNENEGKDSDHNNADGVQPPTTVRIDKIIDNRYITNHGELNAVNNKISYSYSFLTETITIYRYCQQCYCHSYHAYHSIGFYTL
ncbi:hypothetical protein BD770DRAFT_400539 [Pilaira anomala]|nr:hypothetical protein BD770DRAFT_400539 [Pilaira anomala]